MILYEPSDLKRFLECVDAHLDITVELILIGGAAASLAYGASRATVDLDTISNTSELHDACAMARAETGLDIPLQEVGVFDAPYGYEDRLEPLRMGLKRLMLLVPEKHDLALMKTVRGQEHDRAVISQMAAAVGLSREILVERFKNEMDHIVGVPEEVFRWNFLAVIEQLFGETEANLIEQELAGGE